MPGFNVRVYGILINKQDQILVSDLYMKGKPYTKFPGGGLEFGEGTRDCLKREFMEEMGLPVEVGEHFYTTDYFQPSFNSDQQVISIYYFVKPMEAISIALLPTPFAFSAQELEQAAAHVEVEGFRFEDLALFSAAKVSLPIDKVVANMIRDRFTR